jgi:ribosomal protein S27AE
MGALSIQGDNEMTINVGDKIKIRSPYSTAGSWTPGKIYTVGSKIKPNWSHQHEYHVVDDLGRLRTLDYSAIELAESKSIVGDVVTFPWDGPTRSSRFICPECACSMNQFRARAKCGNCGFSTPIESDGADWFIRC